MSTQAQIDANRTNSQLSTGPISEQGKEKSSRNAVKFGLFSATAFIPPDEREEYDEFCADYVNDLAPQTAVEDTLAGEIIQAAWRLRRCAVIEQRESSADTGPEEIDRLQAAVDRARASAHRVYHKSLNELRRVQSERLYRKVGLPENFDTAGLGHASCRDLKPAALRSKREQVELNDEVQAVFRHGRVLCDEVQRDFAKRSQSAPATEPQIARSAPCPCGSGEKYKRCCGRNAPPVLSRAA